MKQTDSGPRDTSGAKSARSSGNAPGDDEPTLTLDTTTEAVVASDTATTAEEHPQAPGNWADSPALATQLSPAIPEELTPAPAHYYPNSPEEADYASAPLEAWELPPVEGQQRVPMVSVSAVQRAHFGRLQVLPGLMGWMVALSALSFFTWAAGMIPLWGRGALSRPLAEMTHAMAGGQSVTALMALGLVYLLAYFMGGYTAGRMARFAGAKQGVAVGLWQVLGCATATVLTYINPEAFTPGKYSPRAAQQFFGSGPVLHGVLGIAGVLALSFLGAIVGGLCGRIYHRRVENYPPADPEEKSIFRL